MRTVALLTIVLFVNLGCSQIKSKPITDYSQNDIKDGILVDVRTPEEFNAGHMDNAININWFDKNFTEQFQAISKEEKIYVYCKKGGRSSKAQTKLRSLGYSNVVNLEGGYDAWAEHVAND